MRHNKLASILVAFAVFAFLAVMVWSSLRETASGNHVMPDGRTMNDSTMSR